MTDRMDRMDQGVGPTSSCKARGSVLTRVPTLIAAAIEDETAMAELLLEWRALADAVQPPSIFLDPAVWQSWRRTLASNAKPLLFVVREAERMVGVLPAMIKWAWRGPTLGVRYDYDPADRRFLTDPPWRMVPLRQLSPISSLPATMLGPMLLAQPEHRREVIFTVTAAIAANKGWDVAVIPLEQPDVALWQDGFAAAKLRSVQQNIDRKSFYLSNAVSFNTVVARQNQKFRANVRRVSRVAERAGIAITISHDRPAMLSWLTQISQESWKAGVRFGEHVMVPFAGPQRDFIKDLLLGTDGLQSVATIAWLGGKPIAIVLGAVRHRTLTTLLTFWTGAAKEASPGLLTMAAMIDWAALNGIEVVDFNANSPWIRHLADHCAVQQNLIAFAPTLRGAALAALRNASVGAKAMLHWRVADIDPSDWKEQP